MSKVALSAVRAARRRLEVMAATAVFGREGKLAAPLAFAELVDDLRRQDAELAAAEAALVVSAPSPQQQAERNGKPHGPAVCKTCGALPTAEPEKPEVLGAAVFGVYDLRPKPAAGPCGAAREPVTAAQVEEARLRG